MCERLATDATHQALRGGGVRLPVRRSQQEQEPALVQHGRLRQSLEDAAPLRPHPCLALLDMTIPFLLIAAGEQAVSSSLAGILVASQPVYSSSLPDPG